MRRTIHLILLLVCSIYTIFGQVDCSAKTIITGVESRDKSDVVAIERSRNLALFSQIDLTESNSLSLYFGSLDSNSLTTCFINDIRVIKDLAEKYSDAEVIKDSDCEDESGQNLIVIGQRSQIYEYRYSDECHLLATNCGIIDFDIECITKTCKSIQIKENEETVNSKSKFDKRVQELRESDDVVFINLDNGFRQGTIKFVFEDIVSSVDEFLKDEFWVDFMDGKFTPKNGGQSTKDKVAQRNSWKRFIVESLIRKKAKYIYITDYVEMDEPNKYLITATYYNELFDPQVLNSVIKSHEKEYEVKYISMHEK